MKDKDFYKVVLEDHLVILEGMVELFKDTTWSSKMQARVDVVKDVLLKLK